MEIENYTKNKSKYYVYCLKCDICIFYYIWSLYVYCEHTHGDCFASCLVCPSRIVPVTFYNKY